MNVSGGELHFLRGAAETLLPDAAKAANAAKVVWNRRYGGGEIAQDKRLKESLRESGREIESFNGALLMEPWELATKSGGAFEGFFPLLARLPEPVFASKTNARSQGASFCHVAGRCAGAGLARTTRPRAQAPELGRIIPAGRRRRSGWPQTVT